RESPRNIIASKTTVAALSARAFCRSAETPGPRLGPNTPAGGSRRDRARSLHRIFAARRQHHGDPRSTGRRAMQQKLFALSLGFAAVILATHHAFAASFGA